MPPEKRSAAGALPKNWPSQLQYLRAPCYSKKIPNDTTSALIIAKSELPTGELLLTARPPFANVKITPIADSSHPANGQHGLFATQHLSPNSFILPYLGYVHVQEETNHSSDYDLSLDRDLGVGVDAYNMGNEARFINDYRGISTGPNAEFGYVFVDLGNGKAEKRMGVFVMSAGKSGKKAKGIAKGDEILVSYGKGFWSERTTTT